MAETAIPQEVATTFRLVGDCAAVTVRHFDGDTSARDAVQALGFAWPGTAGELTGGGPWLAWVSPHETLALALDAEPLSSLLTALASGRSDTAMAADISQAVAVFELRGANVDSWLAHLVDFAAIPREPGRATRCRFAEVAVLLLRLETDCMWLIADRPIAPYVDNWLAYAHG